MAPKPSIVPRLVIIEGKDKGKVITLMDGTAVIGRSKGDLLIQDPRVSRSHVAIHYDEKTQRLSFTDLKSLNGTLLNGKTAEAGELRDGDKLQLGNTLFDCQIGAALDEETSVSKVRDQMQREKQERARAQSSASEGVAASAAAVAQEPDLVEMPEQIKLPPEPALVAEKEHPPAAMPRRRRSLFGAVTGVFGKIPRRLRTLGLVAVVGVGALYLVPTPPTAPPTKSNDFELAAAPVRKFLSQGRLDDALGLALKLQTDYSEVADAHMLVGNLKALQERWEEAITAYEKAKTIAPEDPLVHTNLVRILLRAGRRDEARAAMAAVDQMFQQGKHSKGLFVEVARLLLDFKDELKEPPEKVLILAKALQTQLAPESAIGHKLESQVHDQEGRKKEALDAVDRGLLLEPNDVWLLERSAFLRLEMKDFAGAATTVERWIERHPSSNKPLLIMGYLKLQAGDSTAALRYLQQILQTTNNNLQIPEAREAVYLMGQIAWSNRNFQEAEELYRQACQAGYTPACDQAANLSQDTAPATEEATEGEPPPSAPATN